MVWFCTTVSASSGRSRFFFIRESENECEYELTEHGNERRAGSYGKEKSEAGATGCYSFERATGDETGTV